ncbi:MAG: HEPN domain-containing protein [Pseudomonadota bacterium]
MRSPKVMVYAPRAPLVAEIMQHALTNYIRVEQLVNVYHRETEGRKGRRDNSTIDVLRSAVVFIHATLEDGMRAVIRHKFPRHKRELLDKIPLIGITQSGNPEKFFLGRLVEHRGKSIDDVIEESLTAYLERTSFTSANDLSYWLSVLGVDLKIVHRDLPKIEAMMKRRHHIVHRGDKSDEVGPGKQYARSLNAKLVQDWNTTVNTFLVKITEALHPFGESARANADAG